MILLFLSAQFSLAQSKMQNEASLFDLSHGWEYRWGDSPIDSAGIPVWTYEDADWNTIACPYNPPNRNGRNFLWLRFTLPDFSWKEPAIFLTNAMISLEVWQDTIRVYRYGAFEPGKNAYFAATPWHEFALRPETRGKSLYFRVFSDNPETIGLPLLADNKALVGSSDDILRFIIWNSIDRLVLGSLFVLLGLITIDIFFHRWRQRLYYYLSFATFSICIGLAFIGSGELTQLLFPSNSIRFVLMFGGLAFFPVGFFAFYEQIIATTCQKIMRRIWQFFLIYGAVLMLLIFSGIVSFSLSVFVFWAVCLIISFLIGLYFGIRGSLRGNMTARTFNLGFIATILVVGHDLLFMFGIIPFWHWLSPWGVLIFVLSLSHIIERKNAEDNQRLESYSRAMNEQSQILARKVEERTRDLQIKNNELEATLNQLQQTQQQLVLKEKMASVGMLAAGLAHEINNPIGAVKSAADVSNRALTILKNGLNTKSETSVPARFEKVFRILQENNQLTINAGTRITKIVDSLKKFVRLDQAAISPNIRLNDELENALTLIEHKLQEKIEIVKEFSNIPPITCYPGELNQVFIHLLMNALESIDGKGKITITTGMQGQNIAIKIADTGRGISRENLNKIFSPGFTTKNNGVGTGLGLATSYQIIEKHGGEIAVRSEAGRGTVVSILLPQTPPTLNNAKLSLN